MLPFVKPKEVSHCPLCGELLYVRGTRLRTVVDSSGTKLRLIIRRLKCSGCNRIHHELPDCIVPYKRHCAETIESIIIDELDKAPCESRTAQRIVSWWRVMKSYFSNILKSIAKKYEFEYQEPPAFRKIVRAVVNTNNWIFANPI